MDRPLQLLLISGSLRAGSTNTAVLETVGVIAPQGVATVLYGGMGGLPHFNPDDDREGDPVHGAVAELRAQVSAADALLICTPEYAGALPGALKNLLEWTVGDAGTYRKPVAWINVSGERHRPAQPMLMTLCARCWATSMPTASRPPASASRSRATLSARTERSPTRRSASRSPQRSPRLPNTSRGATQKTPVAKLRRRRRRTPTLSPDAKPIAVAHR